LNTYSFFLLIAIPYSFIDSGCKRMNIKIYDQEKKRKKLFKAKLEFIVSE